MYIELCISHRKDHVDWRGPARQSTRKHCMHILLKDKRDPVCVCVMHTSGAGGGSGERKGLGAWGWSVDAGISIYLIFASIAPGLPSVLTAAILTILKANKRWINKRKAKKKEGTL